MRYTNKNITSDDIRQWIVDFSIAFELIESVKDEMSFEDCDFLKNRLYDAIFLVAYVELQLKIDVDDEVYDRARELQLRHLKKSGGNND